MDVQPNGRTLRHYRWRRRFCPFKKENEVTYSRFRRRIIQGGCTGSPAASTPLTARWRCKPVSEFDSVCQRLELESPSKQQENTGEAKSCSQTLLSSNPSQAHAISSRGHSAVEKFLDQRAGWTWRAAGKADEDSQRAGQPLKDSNERNDLRPFSILNDVGESLQGDSVKTYGAPSLLNDYYTDLLDCSSDGVIALALGSAVYIWNSVTNLLVGHVGPSPDPGGPRYSALSISCLCWSRDGRTLCFGNRRGEIKLWDVDHKQNLRHFQSHQSSVTAISWSRQLLSSGSALGHVQHLDPRAAAVVGAARQEEGVCSLQWSPGNEWFASGSADGHLRIWDGDITGVKRSRQPIITMNQPSAVKALGWCPWQRRVIATGGGWKDGQVRIWDAQSGSCMSSVETNSQICSLRWAEKKRHLITGHGLPYHQITAWSWESPPLSRIHQLTGHSSRVLHLAVNPDNTHVFSAGADRRFCIWDLL